MFASHSASPIIDLSKMAKFSQLSDYLVCLFYFNMISYAKKGLFYERCSIAQRADELEAYDIIRINSGILVNYEYIFRVMLEEVELLDHTLLPISRARRNYLNDFIREKTKQNTVE